MVTFDPDTLRVPKLSLVSPTVSEELHNCLEHHAGSHPVRLLLGGPHETLYDVIVVSHQVPPLTPHTGHLTPDT